MKSEILRADSEFIKLVNRERKKIAEYLNIPNSKKYITDSVVTRVIRNKIIGTPTKIVVERKHRRVIIK